MARDPLLAYTRLVVCDYWDKGRVRPYPTKKNLKKGVPSDQVNDFLRAYVDLLMGDNGFFREATKLYLSDIKISQSGVAQLLTERAGGYINVHTTKTKIHSDLEKLNKAFKDKYMINNVVDHMDTDLEPYWEELSEAITKYSDVRLLNTLAIKLPPAKAMRTKIDDLRFQDFVGTIGPYTPRQMEYVGSNIDIEALGYAKYLLSASTLTETEQEHKRTLLLILKGQD